MKKAYAILNTLVAIIVIGWNYWANTGVVNGETVGELSDKYSNLFTPAGYAFAIWGVIFLGLLILATNQLLWAFNGGDESDSISKMGPWLTLANFGNAGWLWFWLNEELGVSVVIMFFILFSLIQVIKRLNMENWDAPIRVIAFVWWPICAYSGWIAVAAIANVSAWLASFGWSALLTDVQWTVVMICVAGAVNILMVRLRNMREFALVGVWALVAIAVRHWGQIPVLQWTALSWSLVVLTYISVHGMKNRRSNPFFLLLQKD